MTFADPIWLWGIAALIPIMAWRIIGVFNTHDGTSRFVAPKLKSILVHGSNKKIIVSKLVILSCSFSLVLIAMARPQWGYEEQTSFSKGRTVMLAIDASRSMLAQDLTPNRLSRAKLAAYDLIDALPEDLIGLMAFSGSASIMVPVTQDRDALKESIDQLDTYAVAKGGTNLAEAIKEATDTLIESETDSHALILFTDGENLDGDALKEAKKAEEKGTIIVTIGVGSEDGSIIPDDRSRGNQQSFIRDESGNLVKSKLDTESLKAIADAANGIFLRLDTGSLNSEIIDSTLNKLDTKETEFRDQQIPIERFGWPLGIGLILIISVILFEVLNSILMSKPKAITVLFTIFSVCLIEKNTAGVITDATNSFNSGNFTDAVELYQKAIKESKSDWKKAKLNLGLGASAFKASNFDIAATAFGSALLSEDKSIQETAYYNLGNSLFRKGENELKKISSEPNKSESPSIENVISNWEGAIENFESTLGINKKNANAKHNLDVVRRKLEELKNNQDQENQDQENQDQENQDQENQDQENQDQENQDQENQDQENQDQENQDQENQDQENQDQENQDQENQDQENPDQENPDQENQDQENQNQENQDQENQDQENQDQENQDQENQDQENQDQENQDQENLSDNKKINPETGYSKEQAQRQLEALANEQFLRALPRRSRARFKKDW